MNFLFPKSTDFYSLLHTFTDDIKAIADLNVALMADFGNVSVYVAKAREIEDRADQKVHALIHQLHTTFITPFDREDIYALTHQMDDVVDLIENAIHNLQLYDIREKRPSLDAFAQLISEAAVVTVQAVDMMRSQKLTPALHERLMKLHELEGRSDVVFVEELRRLFHEEKDPITLIKWKNIYEILERVMDAYERLSTTIEGIIVKMS